MLSYPLKREKLKILDSILHAPISQIYEIEKMKEICCVRSVYICKLIKKNKGLCIICILVS